VVKVDVKNQNDKYLRTEGVFGIEFFYQWHLIKNGPKHVECQSYILDYNLNIYAL
jgi:hypothetical protein